MNVPLQLGKLLIILGVVLIVVGLAIVGAARFSFFGFGRLPGDIAYKSKNVSFYFPIISCLILSVVLTLVFWVVSLLTKR